MRYVLSYMILLVTLVAQSQKATQAKRYYDSDSTKVKEIFNFTPDSALNGQYESFYLNGSLQSIGWYEDNQPDGTWRFYYENGRQKADGHYKKGTALGKWTYYYESGKIKSSGILNVQAKNGYWTFYYENGKEKSHGNYFDNQKDGIWNYFYEDGSLKAQAFLQGGTGSYTEFYPSGARKMEGENVDEKSQGEWTYYFETGEVEAIGNFEKGLRTGVWTYYHKNGEKAAEGVYLEGKQNGAWKYFHPNGNVSQTGHMLEDEKDGYWKLFYPGGGFQGEANYKNGAGDYKEYHENGSQRSVGNYLDGLKHGEWTYYTESGDLEGKATLDLGKGSYIGYYPNGSIKMQGQLDNDKRVGKWTLYNPDGSVAGTYTPIYENDKPVFKTRESRDMTNLDREKFEKPEYKFKNRKIRYFTPRINEYKALIIGIGPVMILDNQLPVALEYYVQERMGYELQIDLLQDPFNFKNTFTDYQLYATGASIHFKQKFYNPDASLGMFYFGHQISYDYINREVFHTDTLIIQQPRKSGNVVQSGIGYGLFIGNRWMRDAGDRGLTIDAFIGIGIRQRNYTARHEPDEVLNPYFETYNNDGIYFPATIGLTIGFATPKNKSKTQ